MNLKTSLLLKISYQLFSTSEFLNKINWFLKQWERGGPNTVWKIKTVTWRFCIMFPKPVKWFLNQWNREIPCFLEHLVIAYKICKRILLWEKGKKNYYYYYLLLNLSLIIKMGEGSHICKPMPLAVLHCVGQWDDSFQ